MPRRVWKTVGDQSKENWDDKNKKKKRNNNKSKKSSRRVGDLG